MTIEQIYKEKRGTLIGYALKKRLVCQREDAEDLVQEAFVKVIRYLQKHNKGYDNNNIALLIIVMHQITVDRWIVEKRLHCMSEKEISERTIAYQDNTIDYDIIVNKVCKNRLFTYFYDWVCGVPYKEIADRHNISLSNVKANIYRFRQKMIPILSNI